jgi:hypothetical protein
MTAKQTTIHQLLPNNDYINNGHCYVMAALHNRGAVFSVWSMPKSYTWAVLLDKVQGTSWVLLFFGDINIRSWYFSLGKPKT